MAKIEHIRESLSAVPEPDYFQQKAQQGWKLVSIEWERDVAERSSTPVSFEEPPFGLQVADDCLHLKEHPGEKGALMLIMELVVRDESLSGVAEELNRRGYRNRQGQPWSAGQVFDLLPTLIDAGPRILTSGEYIGRKHGRSGPH